MPKQFLLISDPERKWITAIFLDEARAAAIHGLENGMFPNEAVAIYMKTKDGMFYFGTQGPTEEDWHPEPLHSISGDGRNFQMEDQPHA